MARAVSVNQLVVAVNQLDVVGWNEERYDFICSDVTKFLEKIGYKANNICFIPISGLMGLNLDTRDSQPEELKKWYNEEAGKTDPRKVPRCLLEAIDQFKSKPRPIKRPMRACVYDYYQTVQDGLSIISGECLSIKCMSGAIKKKDTLLMVP